MPINTPSSNSIDNGIYIPNGANIGNGISGGSGSSPPPPPSSNYIIESGLGNYIIESGTGNYITESGGGGLTGQPIGLALALTYA